MLGSSKKAVLENIEKLIKISAEKSQRKRTDIKLIAVSKLQSIDAIEELIEMGIRIFGENYLQESRSKHEALHHRNIEWHFIGQIQSKKAKDIVGHFEYVHAVDRMKVAEKLDAAAFERKLRQKILIEVNLAGESTKGGIVKAEIFQFISDLQKLRNLQICGLMIMPPQSDDPEKLRPYFTEARELLLELKNQAGWDKDDKLLFKELSMGTSQDFHVAIEEGATMVRLGTVLFGPRPEQKDLQ